MKKINYAIGMVFLSFLLTSCAPPAREQLANTGIFGEHQLKRVESFGSVTGSVGGSFFLGIGSVAGTVGSEFRLQFYWEPKPGEIVASSLPYSKFKFCVDPKKQIPTVEFIFDKHWLDTDAGEVYGNVDNLNDFVMSKHLKLAVIKISGETLEKEVYLPKVR